MSDTSGATDLDSDMPGIGAAPGNARGAPVGLPSQLQGLVQHFFQTSQGKPNPKFLPPAPGQGQGQGKPPKLGPVDPPDPAAQRYAPIPANDPSRPPPSFNPYIPSMPRDHSQWGQAEAFPRLPQSFELPGMYQNLGKYFAQNGTFASAPLGAGMAAYSAAYQEAFQKGQQEKMRMAAEQMSLHRAQLEEQTENEITGYRDIYNEYSEMAGRDPTKLAGTTVGGVTMHDAVWRKAVELGDKPVIAMLEDGASAEKVMRFQQDREAKVQDLKKANAKSAEEDAASELYGLQPKQTQQQQEATSPWEAMRSGGAAAPTSPAAPAAPAVPGGTQEPDIRTTKAGDPLAPDKDQGADKDADDIDDPIAKNRHDAAVEVLQGNEPADIPKDALPFIGVQARNLKDKIGQILNDAKSGKITPDQIIPEIRRQVGGSVANDAQGILDYSVPGAGQGSGAAGKQAQYKELLSNVAKAVKPTTATSNGWAANNYTAQLNFKDSPAVQGTLNRAITVATAGDQVMQATDALPKDANDPSWWKRAVTNITGFGTGDPNFVGLNSAFFRYNQELTALISSGAAGGGITASEEARKTVPQILGRPADYRVVVAQDAEQAIDRLQQSDIGWRSRGGEGPTPGMNPEGRARLFVPANTEPDHNLQPGQTVDTDIGKLTWHGVYDEKGQKIPPNQRWTRGQ